MWKTLKVQVLKDCNHCTGSMGPSIVMLQQDTCTQKSTSFGFDCVSKMIPEKICSRGTGDSIPPGHVVLQNDASFIPKESQHKHNLPYIWLHVELLQSW
jgi:hypothetical protein